jgi:hypothetical protein
VRVQYEALIGRFIDEISGQIERERARGVAPPGPEARGLATMLMWQAERVLLLTLVDAAHAIDQETLIETAVTLWLRVIYSESDPAVGAKSRPLH